MATFINRSGQRIGKVNASAAIPPDDSSRLAPEGVDTTFQSSGGPGLQPGAIGAGAIPAYLGGQYPSPFLMQTAPYKFTDPFKFAEQYGTFARDQVSLNFDKAKDLALKELDTELAGLRQFVPAASALKREQIGLDNVFNQQQRLAQVNFALPGVAGQLDAQGRRAESYAAGRAPDEVTDRALELGIRSQAADSAYAGGFGTRSSVARKTSDLMSAQQRLGLAQYGEQLLTGNIGTKAGLFLSPTQYSDAGAQVRTIPEVGGARLAASALSEINQQASIPAQTAFASNIQQNQFTTGLEQQTRQINTGLKNNFALGKFQYDVGYAGALAGALQTDINTQLALAQQAQNQGVFSDFLNQSQNSAERQAITSGIAETVTAAAGLATALSPNNDTPVETTPTQPSGVDASTPSQTGTEISDIPGSTPSTNTPGGTVIPSGTDVPDGFTGVATDSGGGTIVVPNETISQPVQNFAEDTGLSSSLSSDPNQGVTKSLLRAGNATMNTAGIYSQPQANTQLVGYSKQGTKVYSSVPLQQSKDPEAGGRFVDRLGAVLDPTGAFTDEDKGTLDQVAAIARDASLAARLNELHQAGDTRGFVNEVLGAIKQPAIENLTKDPKDRTGLNAAFSAYQLFNDWDKLSPAQKSMGLAATGLQAAKFAGKDFANKYVVDPTVVDGKVTTPGITVAQTLNLFQSGYNAYSVVKNWDQLNNLQKVTGGLATAKDVAQTAQQFNLLGTGTQGAAVPNITMESLNAAGLTPAPSYGVGAVTGPQGSPVPPGYTTVATTPDGQVVSIPEANANTAAVSNTSNLNTAIAGAQVITGGIAVYEGIQQGDTAGYINAAGGAANVALGVETLSGGSAAAAGTGAAGASGVATVAAPIAAAAGAYAVYQNWGTGGKEGAVNGALGGAALAGGLYAMGVIAPYAAVAIIAIAMIGGMAKTGKHEDQNQRDFVRDSFRKVKLMDGEDSVTLADGTKVNLGLDGHSGERDSANLDKIRALDKDFDKGHKTGKLHSYDIDYTNDLDYMAGMGGIALSRIVTGNASKPTDQMGGQIGNATIANIGYGKEFSKENFSKWQQNSRAVYAQAGIKSKEEAFQLANQAYAEGRINDSQLIGMHQAYNAIYDDEKGYETAQKLMNGRQRGIEVALQEEAPSSTTPISKATGNEEVLPTNAQSMPIPKGGNLGVKTKESMRLRNSAKFKQELNL